MSGSVDGHPQESAPADPPPLSLTRFLPVPTFSPLPHSISAFSFRCIRKVQILGPTGWRGFPTAKEEEQSTGGLRRPPRHAHRTTPRPGHAHRPRRAKAGPWGGAGRGGGGGGATPHSPSRGSPGGLRVPAARRAGEGQSSVCLWAAGSLPVLGSLPTPTLRPETRSSPSRM